MTEEQIERAVQGKFDRLDARLMARTISQEEYDHEATDIYQWAENELRFRDPPRA